MHAPCCAPGPWPMNLSPGRTPEDCGNRPRLRIAVVQVGTPLQSHVRDLINGLVAQNCSVDLLTSVDDLPGFIDAGTIAGGVVALTTGGRIGYLYRKARARLAAATGAPLAIHPWFIRKGADRFFAGRERYDLLIGVEKGGLELASCQGAKALVPVIYHSLELYIEGHPGWHRFGWQRASEIRCHRLAAATLVQDRLRWECLRRANRPGSDEVYFLPIGASEVADRGIDLGQTPPVQGTTEEMTLLYLGLIGDSRFCGDLIQSAGSLPERVVLHLHGPLAKPASKALTARTLAPGVRVSTDLLSESEMLRLVAQADIGLALYRRDIANDRLTAYSSHKIALYLQAGKPIIAFRSETYEDLMARFHCGELIDSMDELNAAIERIRLRYDAYATAARKAFWSIYRLDRYWMDLASFLSRLETKTETSTA